MKTTFLLAALSTFALARAQSIPASATEAQLDYVEEQYNNSGFDDALPNSQSFNIELDPEALLSVEYGSTVVSNGQGYSKTAVAALPQLYLTPTSESAADFNSSSRFTVMLADASAVGGPDPQGDYRHYLANDATVGDATSSTNLTRLLNPSAGTVITSYAGPGPLTGSGVHRYAWLVFEQPASFAAPANLSTAGTSPSHWSVESYVKESGLGDLVAASFFTVAADGTTSFTAGSTSAASSVAASGSASTGGNRAASASSAASSTPTSGALGLAASGIATLAGVAAFMAIAM